MAAFFFICDYLKITPKEFFDVDSKNPKEIENIISNLKKLKPYQLECISSIVADLIK